MEDHTQLFILLVFTLYVFTLLLSFPFRVLISAVIMTHTD